ncbi:GtrA family protein [Nocardia sp. NBC_00881]|uniref:GtrA family protein n=1 Tax=Nocardia sp. NBC_00881 TaxID=2975995 RepID=UPI0038668C52|nr:GtrA family protein [Nocardia sp. NBC_00881]
MSAADPVGARRVDARRPDATDETAPIVVSALDSSRSADPEPGRAALTGPAAADPGPLLRVVRRQEIAFAMVGVVNTALGMVLTVMWLAVLGDRVPAAVAPPAAYSISVVVAFVLHRTLVFRVRGHLARDFGAFVAVNSGGLLLNMVLLQLAVSVLHLPRITAAVVVMALVAAASFFGHRHISFRRAPAADVDSSRSDVHGR